MYSERRVICLNQSKKVTLFLVEGVTDETAFGLIMSKIIEEKKVLRFKIIGGDITTSQGTNAMNCINRVVDQIKDFLAQDMYQKSDLIEIIHLVDLDGAFISKNHVVYDQERLANGTHIYYTLDDIITDHMDGVLNRNHQKAEVLEKLISTKELFGKLPYQVYYFSCNLEHVLFCNQNLDDSLKYEYVKGFVDRYVDHPKEFIMFMNSEDLASSDNYDVSWEQVKQKEESLKRHSNFHIYLNQYVENV